MTSVVSETYCWFVGVVHWLRRELPLFLRGYLLLCGILLNFLFLLLWWMA